MYILKSSKTIVRGPLHTAKYSNLTISVNDERSIVNQSADAGVTSKSWDGEASPCPYPYRVNGHYVSPLKPFTEIRSKVAPALS